LTLRSAGEAAGLSSTYISEIEKDRANPSLAALDALAVVYGVDVGAFFEGGVIPGTDKTRWFVEGQKAARDRIGDACCPYRMGAARRDWLRGYHHADR